MDKAHSIAQLLEDAYQGVSSIDCTGCSGDCCVSPTLTAPEFVRMMHWAKQNYSKDVLQTLLTQTSREHFRYADNAFCRFQDSHGLCTNYHGRALACRLHGHEAMREFASPGTEFCHRNPAGNHDLSPQVVTQLVEKIRTANELADIPFETPYFLWSLNLEAWLDFAYHPELSQHRPSLQPLWMYFKENLKIPLLPAPILSHTTLAGKLNCIDKLYSTLEDGNSTIAMDLLRQLQEDFPSCGSYYIEEASQMMEMLKDVLAKDPEMS